MSQQAGSTGACAGKVAQNERPTCCSAPAHCYAGCAVCNTMLPAGVIESCKSSPLRSVYNSHRGKEFDRKTLPGESGSGQPKHVRVEGPRRIAVISLTWANIKRKPFPMKAWIRSLFVATAITVVASSSVEAGWWSFWTPKPKPPTTGGSGGSGGGSGGSGGSGGGTPAVPEPASIAMMGVGVAALVYARKRRASKDAES